MRFVKTREFLFLKVLGMKGVAEATEVNAFRTHAVALVIASARQPRWPMTAARRGHRASPVSRGD